MAIIVVFKYIVLVKKKYGLITFVKSIQIYILGLGLQETSTYLSNNYKPYDTFVPILVS